MAETKKSERPKFYAPFWVRRMNRTVIPTSVRNFYIYLCVFGPDSCWLWNWRLAKRFGVSKRQIRRWLHWLKANNLIWIEKPFGPQRKIHPRYFGSAKNWLESIPFHKATLATKKTEYQRRDFDKKKKQQIDALLWDKTAPRGGRKCPP